MVLIIIPIIIIITIIVIIIMFCFFWKCLYDPYQILPRNQEPQVRDSFEVKFEIYCVYLVLNIYIIYIITLIVLFAAYVWCPSALFFEVLLKTELQGTAKHD